MADELFYLGDDGKQQDDVFHNEIIDNGDHKAATAISRKLLNELGWSDADINDLLGATTTEDYNPNHEPSGSSVGGQFAPGEGGITSHGTSQKVLASVIKKGLTIGGKKDPNVYVTNSLRIATSFALDKGQRDGTNPIIFDIKIPKENAGDFKEIWLPSGSEVHSNESFSSKKIIPPAWIIGYHEIDKKNGKLGALKKLNDASIDGSELIHVVVFTESKKKESLAS